MTVPEWTSVLRLAHYWQFREVKALAVRELQTHTIEPVGKISIYQTYNVDIMLLLPSFIALATRTEPLAVDEGRQLGWETAMSVAKARELVRALPSTKPKAGGSAAPKDGVAREYEMNEAEVQKIVEREVLTGVTPPRPTLHINQSFAGGSKTNTPLTAHVNSMSNGGNPFSSQQQQQPSFPPQTPAVESKPAANANTWSASSAPPVSGDAGANGDASKDAKLDGKPATLGRSNTGESVMTLSSLYTPID
jgi:hypothetical protein